jgi:putative membrane protein
MPEPIRRLARRIDGSPAFRCLQQPVLAASLFVGLVVLWLIPGIQFRAMLNVRLYNLMNWSLVIDGLVFWWLVLDPHPPSEAGRSYVTRMAMAFLVIFPMILLGTLIESAHHDLYPCYALCARLIPGLGSVADEQIGGLIIWIPAGMISALATLLIAGRQFAYEDARSRAELPWVMAAAEMKNQQHAGTDRTGLAPRETLSARLLNG